MAKYIYPLKYFSAYWKSKRQTINLSLCFIILISFFSNAQNPGDLDLTFGNGGKVIANMPEFQGGWSVIQTDGKIVVTGAYGSIINGYEFAVLRYDTNGVLDNSFGTNGKVLFPIEGYWDMPNAIALQQDGKIVIAGRTAYYIGQDQYWVFALARLNSDGSFDSTFSSDGKTTTYIQGWDMPTSMAIQPDGKILVIGSSNNGPQNDFAVVRYNSDGTLDETFSADGKLLFGFGTTNDYPESIVIQNDGKIIVAGSTLVGSYFKFAIARINPDGNLDNSFGTNGKVITSVGNLSDDATEAIIQPNGKIVVVGSSDTGVNFIYSAFAVVRYNTDGTLDESFSADGKVVTSIGPLDDEASSVALQSDGKILVGGHAKNNSNPYMINWDYAIVRYKSDGSLDNSFSGDGKLTTSVLNSHDYISSINLQTNGKIIASGCSKNTPDGVVDFSMVRYHNVIIDFNDEISFDKDILVYPNPVKEILTVDFINKNFNNSSAYTPDGFIKVKIEIIDIYGKTMFSKYLTSYSQINMNEFPCGVYFLKMSYGDSISVKKIIKQ